MLRMLKNRRVIAVVMAIWMFANVGYTVDAQVNVASPSVILIEASTGTVIYENNSTEQRSPASITKIMTMLLAFEKIAEGKIALEDEVLVSEYASSMGGSQVFLAEGEVQTLDTMLKCIAVASGNDASVAVAEHIAGSEEAFVGLMNEKAAELGMVDTHFEDSCGLTNSDGHYTTAKDVAIMSKELITKYPEVFNYTQIWMEDIIHETRQGTSTFTLNSTNKLLKQYQWTTGLKTGSTNKAKYCISATACKDGIDLIAVVMGAPDYKVRFQDAQTLLNYGYGVCSLYIDENNEQLMPLQVTNGVEEKVGIAYSGEFRYLDTAGNSVDTIEKKIELPSEVEAPIQKGAQAGRAVYMLNGTEVGSMPIVYTSDVEQATYKDYLIKIFGFFLL